MLVVYLPIILRLKIPLILKTLNILYKNNYMKNKFSEYSMRYNMQVDREGIRVRARAKGERSQGRCQGYDD